MAQSLLPLKYPSRLHLSSSSSPSLPSRSRVSLPYSFVRISTQTHANPVLLRVRAAESSGQNSPEPTQDDTKSTNSNPTNTGINFPSFSPASIPPWVKWVLGPIIIVALPFYKRFLSIEDQIEKTAEVMMDVVEEIAEETEKISSEIAKSLPENSKLKQIALKVEKIADQVDKDAEIAECLIKKVDEMVDKVDEMVEPIIEGKFSIGEKKPKKNTDTTA